MASGNSLPRKTGTEITLHLWTQGFDSSTMYIQVLLPVRAVVSPGREFSPWEMGSGCLVSFAQCPTKKNHNKLLGKCGALFSLWWEYPGMVSRTAGTWPEWAALQFPTIMTRTVGTFSQRRGPYLNLKPHSCCSNIPLRKMQFQNRNHSLPKQQNSTCCEISRQSPGCYLATIIFKVFSLCTFSYWCL